MLYKALPLLLLSAITSVAASANAEASYHPPPPPPPCTAGSTVLLTSIAYPVHAIESIIGIFQNAAWQGIPVSSFTGHPNQIGSVRVLNDSGIFLDEKLTYSHVTPTCFDQKWYFTNGPLLALGIYSYAEHLKVDEKCKGKASEVWWKVEFCATNVTAAAAIFEEVHEGGIATVVKDLGGKKFTSCRRLCKDEKYYD